MNPNRQIQTLRGIQTAKDTLYATVNKAKDEAFTQLLQLLEASMKPDDATTAPPTAPTKENE